MATKLTKEQQDFVTRAQNECLLAQGSEPALDQPTHLLDRMTEETVDTLAMDKMLAERDSSK